MARAKKDSSTPEKFAEPEAWERFERAVDVVIKAKPKHRSAKSAGASKRRPPKQS